MEVRFPYFVGKKPRNWVWRLNLIFQANSTPECYKVSIGCEFLHDQIRERFFYAWERQGSFCWDDLSDFLIGLYGFGEKEIQDYGVSQEYEFSEVWEVIDENEEKHRPVLDESLDAVAVESSDQVDEIDELRMKILCTDLGDCLTLVAGDDSSSVILAELSTGTYNLPFLDRHEVLVETNVKSSYVDNLKYIEESNYTDSVRNIDGTVMLDVKFGVFWNGVVKPCEFGDHSALDSDESLKNAMEIGEVSDEYVETILCYDPGIHDNDFERLNVDTGSAVSNCASVIVLGGFDSQDVVVSDGVSLNTFEHNTCFDPEISIPNSENVLLSDIEDDLDSTSVENELVSNVESVTFVESTKRVNPGIKRFLTSGKSDQKINVNCEVALELLNGFVETRFCETHKCVDVVFGYDPVILECFYERLYSVTGMEEMTVIKGKNPCSKRAEVLKSWSHGWRGVSALFDGLCWAHNENFYELEDKLKDNREEISEGLVQNLWMVACNSVVDECYKGIEG